MTAFTVQLFPRNLTNLPIPMILTIHSSGTVITNGQRPPSTIAARMIHLSKCWHFKRCRSFRVHSSLGFRAVFTCGTFGHHQRENCRQSGQKDAEPPSTLLCGVDVEMLKCILKLLIGFLGVCLLQNIGEFCVVKRFRGDQARFHEIFCAVVG